jgi:predicted unusual protein kinase regulating ubiquinone biosynthesis (AarF/ABC1/UbiB family)
VPRPQNSPKTPPDDPALSVPRPNWGLSGRTVLTIGWAEGIGLNEVDRIAAAGIDRVALGRRVLTLFLKPCAARRLFPCRHASGQPEGRARRQPGRL